MMLDEDRCSLCVKGENSLCLNITGETFYDVYEYRAMKCTGAHLACVHFVI